MNEVSLSRLAFTVVARELRLAFRRWDQIFQPLIFFVIVTALFPLAVSPEPSQLRLVGPGVVWVAAMLASLLSLESLFRPDVEDGTMEQWVLSGQPLSWLLLFKTVAHWVLTGVPLLIVSPLVAAGFRIPNDALPILLASLSLGTGVLSILGATGAALTVSVRRGNVLMALLVLPLQVPVLIFGAYAVNAAMRGDPTSGPMYFLGAMLLLALALGPMAMAAAIRISVES
jgi:heme exporter protein B